MTLSDRDIRRAAAKLWPVQGEAGVHAPLIHPFQDDHVGPCSVDLTLDDHYIRCGEEWYADEWTMFPGEFMLATTIETVNIPDHLSAQVSGKSSWMRKGLQVCSDAGYIDAGFKGQITLELKNLGYEPIKLWTSARICQLVFTQLSSPAEYPYGHPKLGSHYMNQTGVTRSAL